MGWAAEWIAKFLSIFYRLSRNFLKHELPLFPSRKSRICYRWNHARSGGVSCFWQFEFSKSGLPVVEKRQDGRINISSTLSPNFRLGMLLRGMCDHEHRRNFPSMLHDASTFATHRYSGSHTTWHPSLLASLIALHPL